MTTLTEHLKHLERKRLKAKRALNNLRSYLRRGGLTGWVSRDAAPNYRYAARCIREAALAGADVTDLFDRLRALRQEGIDVGLLARGDADAIDALGLGQCPSEDHKGESCRA